MPSLISGLAFLLLYALALRALTPHLDSPTARLALALPVARPLFVYYALPISPALERPTQLIFTIIIDIVYYSHLAYALLAWPANRSLKLS